MSTEPNTLSPRFAEMPSVLRARDQWVLWRWMLRDGRWTKPPFGTDGKFAKSNDPATWSTFEEVERAALNDRNYAGVGFCLSADDGLTGIDLDHCIDPVTLAFTQPEAEVIVRQFAGTYIERSPSGDGLRIWAVGRAFRSGKAPGAPWIEVYSYPSRRYLTVTGHRWGGSAK
jgi:primase-polymerase (primpol)-like protein